MKRLALTLLLTAVAAAAHAQTAPVLRGTSLVSGDLVRIGDLVDNVPTSKARIAVFRAPDLGETGSVPVAAVIDALRPHDVVAVDTAGYTQISVTRASRVVGSTEIRTRIAELMAERLRVADASNVALALDMPLQALHLDPTNTAPLNPLRSTIDRSGRFDVSFKSDSGKLLRVTGIASEAYEALVATRPLARGEIVRASDVTVEKRPKIELQNEGLRDPAAAIGMAVQQPLRPGQPIKSSDVAKAQLVKRGEPVLLHYEVPGISLTARGKAEDSGALGDTVNILNIQSKRVVQAVVTGLGQVTVTSISPRVTTPAASQATVQQMSALNATR